MPRGVVFLSADPGQTDWPARTFGPASVVAVRGTARPVSASKKYAASRSRRSAIRCPVLPPLLYRQRDPPHFPAAAAKVLAAEGPTDLLTGPALRWSGT